MAPLKRQNKARMSSTQAKNTTTLGISVYYLRIRPPFLSSGNDTKVHKQIAFKNFHQHEKKVIFYMFRKIKQATRNCGSKP